MSSANTPAFKRAEFSSQISKDQKLSKAEEALGNVGILVYLIKEWIPVLDMFQHVVNLSSVYTSLFPFKLAINSSTDFHEGSKSNPA